VVGYLERAGLAELIPNPGARRGKVLALTERGEEARTKAARKLARLEETWEERHGRVLERVRETLAPLDVTFPPHPARTWRAKGKELARLPRFPLVTHRGGFPDGA
jgi:hypothetical protein